MKVNQLCFVDFALKGFIALHSGVDLQKFFCQKFGQNLKNLGKKA